MQTLKRFVGWTLAGSALAVLVVFLALRVTLGLEANE